MVNTKTKKKTTKKVSHKKVTKKAATKQAVKPKTVEKITNELNSAEDVKKVDYWMIAFVALVAIVLGFAFVKMFGPSSDSTVGNNGANAVTGDAKVTIIEYSDFECPFCGKAQPTLKQVKDTYGDQVEIVFKHFPLSFHAKAQKASEASECARDQGMFWEYHDVLFTKQTALDVDLLKQYAVDLGMDATAFNACLDSDEKAAVVAAAFEEGKAAGVTGTPAFFINGKKLVGAQPFSEFKKIIDKELNDDGTVVPEPDVSLLIVNDLDCKVCDSARVVTVLQENVFQKLASSEISMDTEEGKALIEKYNVQTVPAYFLSKNSADAANFVDIEQALVDLGEYYLIAPQAVGGGKLLNPPSVDDDAVLGESSAPVTIVIFSDYECPYCGAAEGTHAGLVEQFTQRDPTWVAPMPAIIEKYVETGKVKIVFRDFPLAFHASAQKAAEATECAEEEGKFWEMHDKLFENQEAIAVENLKQYAKELGLNSEDFDNCLDSGKYADEVAKDLADGQALGVSGTPAFFINGVSISGAAGFSTFEPIIEAELGN